MSKIKVELADSINQFCNCCPHDKTSEQFYRISFLIGRISTTAIYLCKEHLKELCVEGIKANRENSTFRQ